LIRICGIVRGNDYPKWIEQIKAMMLSETAIKKFVQELCVKHRFYEDVHIQKFQGELSQEIVHQINKNMDEVVK
jgi:hypothetical protein